MVEEHTIEDFWDLCDITLPDFDGGAPIMELLVMKDPQKPEQLDVIRKCFIDKINCKIILVIE